MVLGNSPVTHPAVAFAEKAIYEELEGGNRPDMRVRRWEKTQELRSGKVTLWDHCFELPGQHLDAERPTQESVAIGKVTHKLKLPANDPLELYDYPGAYAQRVDGIDPGGGEKAGDLAKIFQDNKRTAAIRMEQEAVQAINIRGSGNCRQFMAGCKFTLERHHDADGAYVLTTIEHNASASAGGRSGADDGSVNYQNHFTCIPIALPYRPALTTPEPVIPGPQTAVVVGTPGEIIFCDKYGRIKVQFPWDREGKKNADSSCWIRVSNNWGGANWGGMFLPHVGQEVIVEFEEGDPDRPIVTGRVYNAECMPPLKLPDHKTKSAIRDHGGNEMIMEGNGGDQRITFFSPTGSTKFSMGAHASPTPGFYWSTDLNWEAFVKGFENVEITKWSHRQLKADASEHIEGHWHQIIDKTSKVEVKDKQSEFVMGPVHKNIALWVSVFVGGFKTEVTVGAETKLIKGAKSEIVHGSQIKYHKGRLFEMKPADTENCKGNHLRKMGTAIMMSTKNMIAEARAGYRVKVAQALEYVADKVTQTAKSRSSLTAASMLCSIKESLEHAADNYKVQASNIKAKADTDWNDGTLKIKK
jgi:type VI secretion system secreted protein VgrG